MKYGHEQNYFMTKGSTCILYKYHDNEVHIFKLKYGQKLHMCTSLSKVQNLELKYGHTQNWFMAKGSTHVLH